MKIQLHDGFGRPFGMLEIPEAWLIQNAKAISQERGAPLYLEWETERRVFDSVAIVFHHELVLYVRRVIPFGFAIRVKWKERQRLERAGFILPYEQIFRLEFDNKQMRYVSKPEFAHLLP